MYSYARNYFHFPLYELYVICNEVHNKVEANNKVQKV